MTKKYLTHLIYLDSGKMFKKVLFFLEKFNGSDHAGFDSLGNQFK